jgi:hypothetical protein
MRRRPRDCWLVVGVALTLALARLGWYFGFGRNGNENGGAAATGRAELAPAGGQEGSTGSSAVGPVTKSSAPDGASPGDTAAAAAGSTAGSASPCGQVLTTGEAAAALGRVVGRVQTRDGFLVRYCTFWSRGGDRYVILQIDRGLAASQAQFGMS